MNPFGFQILTILTVVNGDTAFLTICLAKRVQDNLKELWKMELADNVAVNTQYISHCLKISQKIAFGFWNFALIFVVIKVTCLVTLFDRKQQVFKKSPNRSFVALKTSFCPLDKLRSLRSQC